MSTVPRLFAASLSVDPDAIAVARGSTKVSYQELDARANSLAHKLIARGVRPRDLVVVDIPRSIEYVIAILGVLKSGAAYVPIDRRWPQARKDFVLQDTNATTVTERDIHGTTRDAPEVTPGEVAYVMYTSGSTGRPKGVMISHAGIEAMTSHDFWRNGAHDRVLALASTAFDASTYEIWVPLLGGGQVVFPEHDVDIATIEHEIGRHRITSTFLTAALFHLVANEKPQALNGLKEVWSGGDVVQPDAAQRILQACPGIEVYNAYGPTENTVFVSRHRVTDTSGPLPIGLPFPGVETRIEDGELLIAGPQLALGYHNRTTDRFRDGWYRTGDRVTRREDGTLEFRGRVDRQVKIRGFRVELEEVEAALRPHTDDCTVTAENGRLIAYVVSDNADLREELAKTLPEYLIPAEFVHLNDLPRNHADKVDRTRLRTADEQLICDIAQDILGVELSPQDRFIQHGDSISAIQLVSRARANGLRLAVDDVLEHDIRTLAAKATRTENPIQHEEFGEELPLTPLQEGLYFHALIEPGSYLVQLVFHLKGKIDAARLHWAARMVVTRNPALRAGFRPGPVQIVEAQVVVPWQETDDDLDAFLALDSEVRFDVATPPLLRFTLVQNDILVLSYHHLLFDGWSVPVLLNDLFALYHNEELPSPVPFHHHLAWLRRQPRTDAWREILKGLDQPTLVANGPGTRQHARVDGTLRKCAKQLAQDTGTTLNTVVQTAWALLLATMTGRSDVVFGTTVSGRPADLPDVERVVGALINTVPVRITLNPDEPAHDLLKRVRTEQHALIAHHHVSLAEIQREAGLGQLFDTATVLESWPDSAVDDVTHFENLDAPHYPLSLAVRPDLTVRVNYRPDLFRHEEIRTILRRLGRIIDALAANTTTGRIDALDPEEHLILDSWNATETATTAKTLPELVAEQARSTPYATAISYRGTEITYAELLAKVIRVARQLPITRNDRVALKMRRSPDLVIAMLAVTARGAAFVPIDPDYPQARIDLMLEDCQPKLVLETLPAGEPGEHTGPALGDPAYVIYTSGSTGSPKGVEVSHRGIASLAAVQREALDINEDSRVLQWASPSFDAAFWEIIGALLNGATLVIADAPDLKPGDRLSDLLYQQRITHITLPPSVLAALQTTAIPPYTTITAAGETCPPDLAARWSKGRRFLNAYGPTEATVCATISDPITGTDAPIGRPVANTKVHVRDQLGRPVPPGVVGELHIEGPAVANGYLHGQRFNGTYATGDLARWHHDGVLEHVGRKDDQITLRGHRIEPAEVEHAINQHESVRTSAVVATGTSLVAFVAGDVHPAALRAHLHTLLPQHLVPSIERITELPLTPNGKLDRRALIRRAHHRAVELSGLAEPATPAQKHVCDAFAEVLGRDRVGVHDSFVDLGGDSLLLVRLQEVLARRLHRHVPVADLQAHSTPAALAGHLERPTPDDDRVERLRAARARRGSRGQR